MKILRLVLALVTLVTAMTAWAAAPFVPDEPTIPVSQLKRGMKGYAKTAVPGNRVITFPVEVLDVVESPTRPTTLVLVKAMGKEIKDLGGIAAGMSGSPVYFDGRLAGALGYSWSFSDHNVAAMTPIADMARVFDYKDIIPARGTSTDPSRRELMGPLTVSGLSPRAVESMGRSLGVPVMAVPASGDGGPVDFNRRLRPGEAISVQLAWGDVDVGVTGTVSAVSRDGRFLAFGHSMKNYGAVAFPVATATIHHIVSSLDVPFKLASPGRLIGLVTQDRIEGVGGQFGRFAPAMSVEVHLKDESQGIDVTRSFRAVPVWPLLVGMLPDALSGLIDSELNRVGPGTADVRLQLSGRDFYPGWKWNDVVVDNQDVAGVLTARAMSLIGQLATNPFIDLQPMGVKLDLSLSSQQKKLYLERLSVEPDVAAPGETVKVSLVMRPWRDVPVTKVFDFKVPDDWSGSCTVSARGGKPEDVTSDGGDARPADLKALLADMTDTERACEVIVSLDSASPDPSASPRSPQDERRQKMLDGTMRVFQSGYAVDGSLSTVLTIDDPTGQR